MRKKSSFDEVDRIANEMSEDMKVTKAIAYYALGHHLINQAKLLRGEHYGI